MGTAFWEGYLLASIYILNMYALCPSNSLSRNLVLEMSTHVQKAVYKKTCMFSVGR